MTKAQWDYLFAQESLADVERPGEAPLHVTRHGDPGRYWVRSETDAKMQRRGVWKEDHSPSHYLVDMTDPEFPHGRCSCQDSEFRIVPKVIRRQKPLRRRCKHGRSVACTLSHARTLCEAAGIEFTERIIPTLYDYSNGCA